MIIASGGFGEVNLWRGDGGKVGGRIKGRIWWAYLCYIWRVLTPRRQVNLIPIVTKVTSHIPSCKTPLDTQTPGWTCKYRYKITHLEAFQRQIPDLYHRKYVHSLPVPFIYWMICFSTTASPNVPSSTTFAAIDMGATRAHTGYSYVVHRVAFTAHPIYCCWDEPRLDVFWSGDDGDVHSEVRNFCSSEKMFCF